MILLLALIDYLYWSHSYQLIIFKRRWFFLLILIKIYRLMNNFTQYDIFYCLITFLLWYFEWTVSLFSIVIIDIDLNLLSSSWYFLTTLNHYYECDIFPVLILSIFCDSWRAIESLLGISWYLLVLWVHLYLLWYFYLRWFVS